jgi:thioredoxin 1
MSKFKDLINGDVPVLVDFHATWCGPCKTLAPILQQLANDLKGEVKILKVDVDRNQDAAAVYNVSGVPTLILFHKGVIKWRQSGVVPLYQLKQTILSKIR